MAEVEKAIASGEVLDKGFLESASLALHDKWLERNGSWAPAEQKRPYLSTEQETGLSEEEKEKDRVIIL